MRCTSSTYSGVSCRSFNGFCNLLKHAGLLLFILWAYHPEPWSQGALAMTAGWHGAATFTNRTYCEAARSLVPLQTVCLDESVQITKPRSVLR